MIEVSIITAAYNAEKYIQETIDSVKNQIFSEWELIIVDDCSTDSTVDIVLSNIKRDSRISILRNEENRGPGVARNNGIVAAKGRYLAFIDSDDIWFPDKLFIQLKFMKELNVPISYTSYELIDSDSNLLNKKIQALSTPIDYKNYLGNTIIGFSTSMIDRMMIPEVVLPALPSREDTFLWISLLKKGYLAYGITDVLVKYRVHRQSISSGKAKAAMQVWNLYRKKVGLSFIQTFYYFSKYAFNAIMKRL